MLRDKDSSSRCLSVAFTCCGTPTTPPLPDMMSALVDCSGQNFRRLLLWLESYNGQEHKLMGSNWEIPACDILAIARLLKARPPKLGHARGQARAPMAKMLSAHTGSLSLRPYATTEASVVPASPPTGHRQLPAFWHR